MRRPRLIQLLPEPAHDIIKPVRRSRVFQTDRHDIFRRQAKIIGNRRPRRDQRAAFLRGRRWQLAGSLRRRVI